MRLFQVLLRNLLLVSLAGVYRVATSTGNGNLPRKFHLTTRSHTIRSAASAAYPPPPPSPPPSPLEEEALIFQPMRLSIAVVVGVLSALLTAIFLLLLYAKHCRSGSFYYSTTRRRNTQSAGKRKVYGVDRAVVESLPIFRFGSLRGDKDGLECAVCLNPFEPTEVLKLLPKCKHAFHVECVDKWLITHGTCPLCRHQVDLQDLLFLADDIKTLRHNEPLPPTTMTEEIQRLWSFRRVSGRHSSVGERHDDPCKEISLGARRSLDGWMEIRQKKPTAEMTSAGCFDRHNPMDEIMQTTDGGEYSSKWRRLEHRIVISATADNGERWSDAQPSDVLCLRLDQMIMNMNTTTADDDAKGRSMISGRSVSDSTGLRRFLDKDTARTGLRGRGGEEAREGLASRWWAWISHFESRSHVQRTEPAVRSGSMEGP
ncbi:hypothetical protein NMG60_11001066 [Bertholletia excelsa]